MTGTPLLLAALLSAGNAEFDTDANRHAGTIAIERLRCATVERGLEPGTLEKAMCKNPAPFVRTNEAHRLCREIYTAALAHQYQTAAAAILRQLNLPSGATNEMHDTVEKTVAAHFAKAFATERAAAVAAQARAIASNVRPSEADLETREDATLRREMTEKIAARQQTPVFEENLQYISDKIVEPVLEDGRREMKRQREYLMRTKCEAYAPEALAREIEANLRRNLTERQAKERDPAKAWGVFPGVLREGLPAAVERRTTGVVAKEISRVSLTIDPSDIWKRIKADPKAHRTAAKSEKIFRERYATYLKQTALKQATTDAPESERAAFSEFVQKHLSAPDLTRAVETRLKSDWMPKWRQIRRELAKDEARRTWPTLTDRTWFPAAELADRMVAKSDYDSAVKSWRKTPELARMAKYDSTLLEESASEADQSMRAAFDLARKAIAAQKEILNQVHPAIREEAKSRQASFWRRTPDFKTLVSLLTEAVESQWDEQRVNILWPNSADRPRNAADQHTQLFPSVRKCIEQVAREILEELEKPEPDPEPPEPLLTYSIVIERQGDEVKVKLEQGKSTVAERATPAKISDYRDAVKFVSDKLGTDILKLK